MAGESVAIIIPTYNAAATVSRCVTSVITALESWGGEGEIIVVDHGSSDGTVTLVRGVAGEGVTVLERRGGTVGMLRNHGTQATRASVLAFVDADCVVPSDYLRRAVQSLDEQAAAAVGSYYSLPSSPGWIARVWHGLHAPPPDGPVRWLPGGNLVVRREAFETVGGFAPVASGEDVDLCARLRNHGFTVYHDRRLQVVHHGNPPTLGAFFRQQRWHGLGMLATARGLDRPLAMTALHLALTAIGVVVLAARSSPGSALLAASLQVVAPLVSVAFRLWQGGRLVWRELPHAVALYWLYYWARAAGLVDSLRSRSRPLSRASGR